MELVYSPLPTSQSIRLLEFQPHSGDLICVSLITTELRNAPAFDALSYTWGSPFSQWIPQSRTITDEATHPLLCDGQKTVITENLHDALVRLRDLDLVNFQRSVSKYLFVDAISINQKDDDEKAAQVSMMADIFGAADKVLGWLGPEDSTTTDVFMVIDSLSTIPRSKCHAVTPTDIWTPESYPSKLGISPLTYQHWLALVAFLYRPFFERIWIINEMVAAKEIFLVCGQRVYTWETVSAALKFLAYSGWLVLLHTDQISAANVVPEKVPTYQKLMGSRVEAGHNAWHLFLARNAMLESTRIWTLPSLLMNHRKCKSTDPRDQVYALLGIARKNHRPFDTQPHLYEVDYSHAMTVQRLFTRTARSLLRAWDDFAFLSHKEGSFATKIDGLPSWVPDYSVECMPDPLKNRSKACHWRATGILECHPDRRDLDSPYLDVQGFCVDTVKRLAADPVGLGIEDMTFFWSSLADVARDVRIPYRISDARDEKISISRTEILWRTLIADTYTGHHPAPSVYATQFVSHICAELGREAKREGPRNQNTWTAYFQPKWWMKGFQRQYFKFSLARCFWNWPDEYFTPFTQPWLELIDEEPEGSPFTGSLVAKELVRLQEASKWQPRYLEWSQAFAQFRREFSLCSGRRRLMCTTEGLLGVGPTNMCERDEVWILAGCPTPVVLRRLPNGHFMFLGEAYVHGIMHGEAVQSDTNVVDIVLE